MEYVRQYNIGGKGRPSFLGEMGIADRISRLKRPVHGRTLLHCTYCTVLYYINEWMLRIEANYDKMNFDNSSPTQNALTYMEESEDVNLIVSL